VQGWIERDGKYLLLKRNMEPKRGEWDLPGGFVEMGESPIEATLREVHEETGLDVEITGMIGAFSSEYTPGKWTVDIAYRCRIAGGEFDLDREESSDSGWFAPDDMPELAFPGERQALAALLADSS
jgi:ADP-ribose pyrophosphatase YjhB (NUDIX family)